MSSKFWGLFITNIWAYSLHKLVPAHSVNLFSLSKISEKIDLPLVEFFKRFQLIITIMAVEYD